MSSPHPPLYLIFKVFFIFGLLTFGGGYGMIPLLQYDFVSVREWMTASEFQDAVAIGLISPGPVAIIATFIGYRLAFIPGAIVATLGVFIPSILIVCVFSKFYQKFEKTNLAQIALPIVNATVIGLLSAAVFALGKFSTTEWYTILLAIITFAVIYWIKISPIWAIIICGFIGLLFF